MKKNRWIACILAMALIIGTLSGCGSDASSSPESSQGASSSQIEENTQESASGSVDDSVLEDWVKEVGLTSAENNEQAPDWTAYDQLVSDIYMETDGQKREAMLHEAEDLLMATGAVVPIYYYNDMYLENTSWTNDIYDLFGTKYFMYCLKDGQKADVMRINIGSEPDRLDPALNTTVDGSTLASSAFVGLYRIGADEKIEPALADGDPEVSEDGTQYTIHLKEGLKWSDGSDLTANDFIYSWNRAADPETASSYSYLFAVIDGYGDGSAPDLSIDAPDDVTITVKLSSPCTYFMNLLAFPVYMPVPQKAVESADTDGTNPGAWAEEAGFVCNGAYTLESWKHNESMVYVKNPYYYDAENVTVDELDFMLSADDTAILAAFKSGDLDYADTIPVGEVAGLKDTPEFHVIDNLGTYFISFNVNSEMFEGKTAQQAAAVRRALSLLIDRQYIVDTIGQTEQKVATSFIPAGMSDGNGGEFKTNDDDYSFPVGDGYFEDISVAGDDNVEKARELLTYAGYQFDESGKLSAETPININYLTNENSTHEAIAQAVQQDLDVIGVTMTISIEDWQTFVNDRHTGNFDVCRSGWLADYDDAINMIEMFQSSSGNDTPQLGK